MTDLSTDLPKLAIVGGNRPTLDEIARTVCWFYRIDKSILWMKTSNPDRALVRGIFYFLAHELTGATLFMLARFGANQNGGRYYDHTTVLSAKRKVIDALATDERLADEIEVMKLHIRDLVRERQNRGGSDVV